MQIGLKKSMIPRDYTMLGETLVQVKEHTYLGVTISENLTWESNHRRTVSKANRILGLLQRNIYQCSRDTKIKAYKALVRPHLEYAAAVTDPYQTKYIQMLDKVQRRAARFVVNNYRRRSSVTDMINELEWECLAERRKNARLCTFYSIHNGESPIIFNQLHRRDTKHSSRHLSKDSYNIIESRTNRHKNSFLPRTICDWNRLPLSITSRPSLESFKVSINC